MNAPDWWFNSGQAAQAARSLVWFVVAVFVGLAIVIYLDIKKGNKNDRDKKR